MLEVVGRMLSFSHSIPRWHHSDISPWVPFAFYIRGVLRQ